MMKTISMDCNCGNYLFNTRWWIGFNFEGINCVSCVFVLFVRRLYWFVILSSIEWETLRVVHTPWWKKRCSSIPSSYPLSGIIMRDSRTTPSHRSVFPKERFVKRKVIGWQKDIAIDIFGLLVFLMFLFWFRKGKTCFWCFGVLYCFFIFQS